MSSKQDALIMIHLKLSALGFTKAQIQKLDAGLRKQVTAELLQLFRLLSLAERKQADRDTVLKIVTSLVGPGDIWNIAPEDSWHGFFDNEKEKKPDPGSTSGKVELAMKDAQAKAWKALAGYKFLMFGYHAARWVNYNKLLQIARPNPFRAVVNLAKTKIETEQ
jgi:hypothetical protein